MVVVSKLALERSRKPSVTAARFEPKPCRRFAEGMLLNAKFIARLPACEACGSVLAYLNRESESC